MNVARPYLALMQPVRAATLLALRRTVTPLTGREVARRAGVSQPAALTALDHLVAHGLVRSQPAGRANLYSLNEEHLLVAALTDVFEVRAGLVKRIAESVRHWEIPPLNVTLFGSMARGDGDTQSDVDLLVVRPGRVDDSSDNDVWRGQLDTLAHEIDQWTGNRAALVEISEEEARTLSRRQHRLLHDVRRDGVRVSGETLDELALAASPRGRHAVAG